MAQVDLHITQPHQLWEVVRQTNRIRRIKLDLPHLPAEQRALTEHRLAQLIRPCGCTEGAIAMLISIPVALTLFHWGWPPDAALGVPLSSALAVVVGASLIGKAIGIFRGKRALHSYVQRLFTEIQT
ncbi:hypothetical protein [Loktanella sp. Alg231-35]|uniref:hypothetical protein n=1 Tax=Loktanella sp. Alg231-35 TaxID=1922220 RepID=UPI000D562034|nr:hypothetical protein [Loktanella sp. Alg231-35]